MSKITLLRHGQTDYNAKGLLQGRIDSSLNRTGFAQAKKAAEAIGQVDRIISSPLKRAIQTAEAFNKEIEISDAWIELDYGEWDGKSVASIPKEIWEEWKNDPNFKPPKGESLKNLGQRVRSFLETLDTDDDEHVLIVTHVSPIKASIAWALGASDDIAWRTRLEPASFSQIHVKAGTPILTKFNVTNPL